MHEQPVLYEVEDAVAVLTLNRPDNRNSMTPDLLASFSDAVEKARGDASVRCVVITGRGRCFSAGADFRSQVQAERDGRTMLPHERSFAMYEPFLGVLGLEVPVVAALNGHAVGGGFGLALLCDLRVGSLDGRYGANFARLGLHPGLGISYLLPRLVGVPRALELLLTGRLVDGREADAMGLFNQAVAPESVLPQAMALARAIAVNAPIAVRMMKRTLYQSLGWDVPAAARAEAFAQAVTLDTDDAREGMAALLAKREPVFIGR